MSVIFDKRLGPSRIVVRTIDPREDLTGIVTAADIASAGRFTHPARRADHLAARAALRALLPDAQISYNSIGAPVLDSPESEYKYVGFSHCRGAAAAVVSAVRCAVDIESAGRDFTAAAPRFVSDAERHLSAAGHPMFLPALWCAKETLYKYAGVSGLDFKADLQVLSADLSCMETGAPCRFTGRIGRREGIRLCLWKFDGFVLCCTDEEDGDGEI